MTVTIVSGVCGVSDAPSVSATLPTPCEMLERNRRAGFPRIRDPNAPQSRGKAGISRRVAQQNRALQSSNGRAEPFATQAVSLCLARSQANSQIPKQSSNSQTQQFCNFHANSQSGMNERISFNPPPPGEYPHSYRANIPAANILAPASCTGTLPSSAPRPRVTSLDS